MPQSCSPQLLPNFRKLFSKAPLQSGCPKAMLQTCSPKLFSKATPESCSPKLLPKAAVLQSCRAKLLLKAAPQSCSLTKLCPKLSKAAPKLRKAPQSCCCPKLPAGLESACSPKLRPNAVLQSCSPKLLPKAAILQTCSPKRLPKAILHSGSRKLRLNVATRKLLSKAIAPKLFSIFFQTYTPKGSPKLFCKATPESCH